MVFTSTFDQQVKEVDPGEHLDIYHWGITSTSLVLVDSSGSCINQLNFASFYPPLHVIQLKRRNTYPKCSCENKLLGINSQIILSIGPPHLHLV